MSLSKSLYCPCCHEETLEVRFDKHQRPYAVCDSCSVKIFGRGAKTIVGLTLTSDVVGAYASRVATDRASWEIAQKTRARVEGELRGLVARAAAATAATIADAPAAAAGGAR